MKRNKKGVVLLVTIMMLLLLLSIVNVFLSKTHDSKKDVTYMFALNQTNYIMYNIIQYIHTLKLDEESLFYASKIAYPIALDDTELILHISSVQDGINLSTLITQSIKSQEAQELLLNFFSSYKLQNPNYLLDLLQDTIDKDVQERASQSEIILNMPTFRNGKIYNKQQLEIIKEYYYERTADDRIFDMDFFKIFRLRNSGVDINFLNYEMLRLLFDDANEYSLKLIAKHEKIYAKFSELPFDELYNKQLEKRGKFGQSLLFQSRIIKIDIELQYKTQFKSVVIVEYDMKNKNIVDYKIKEIKVL